MRPTGNNILVKLPAEQKEGVRKLDSGIFIPALLGNFHNDFTFGEVVAIGEQCTNVLVGDTVFFNQMAMQQALQNSGLDRTRNQTLKDSANNIPVYYIEDKTGEYIAFPSEKVTIECSDISGTHYNTIFMSAICAIRNGEVICLNGFYLFKKAYDDGQLIDGIKAKVTASGLFLPMLKDTDEKEKRYKCLFAPEEGVINAGDIFYSAPHTDIALEGIHNHAKFPVNTYYVEEHNILAVENKEWRGWDIEMDEAMKKEFAQTPTLQMPTEALA